MAKGLRGTPDSKYTDPCQNPGETSSRSRIFLNSLVYVCVCIYVYMDRGRYYGISKTTFVCLKLMQRIVEINVAHIYIVEILNL